jgi:hypothetical protein
MWGTNVRAGISRFLARRPEWRLVHPPFSDVYPSIGAIFRPETQPTLLVRLRSGDGASLAPAAYVASVAAIVVGSLGGRRVVEIATGDGVLADHLRAAGADARVMDLDALLAAPCPTEQAGSEVVAALGWADQADDAALGNLLSWLARRDRLALLGVTAPGEQGVAGPHSRPLRRLVEMVESAGLAAASPSRLELGVAHFPFVNRGDGQADSSFAACLIVAGPRHAIAAMASGANPVVSPLEAARAEEVEQAELQRVHCAAAIRWMFGHIAGYARANEQLQQLYQQQLTGARALEAEKLALLHALQAAQQRTEPAPQSALERPRRLQRVVNLARGVSDFAASALGRRSSQP